MELLLVLERPVEPPTRDLNVRTAVISGIWKGRRWGAERVAEQGFEELTNSHIIYKTRELTFD
ncbi:hypothetical protein [Kitasatospora sp. NPDC088351]|uniref:hypothetical protein n=1 Tax=Kitasatospora sp. NPDC088351 TaxID=3155180 RepID=UPI00344946B8